jgi:hypothetical protein
MSPHTNSHDYLHEHRPMQSTYLRLLKDPGEEPSMPLLSGGVAPISQPTSRDGGDSPIMCLHNTHTRHISVSHGLAVAHFD